MRHVGIDVSAKTLDVVIRRRGKNGKVKNFANTSVGHNQLIQYINPKKHEARVCLEATGAYHFDLTLRLSDSPNIDVMVVNPKRARRFAESLNEANKDDDIDACVLAEFCERMSFLPWEKPPSECIKLRAYSRRLSALTSLKAQNKNQLHAHESSRQYCDKDVMNSIKRMIQYIEKQIAKLEVDAVKFIQSEPELAQCFQLLLTVKGIATTSAIQLLGELLILPKDLTHKQWVRFAGLNPIHYKSGTSIKKKSRISRAGNRHLRKALYMPALSAAQHDPYVRGYYLHLINDSGLKKIQALCAVMRKLLHAIHAMLNKRETFDNTRFYSSPVQKKNKALLCQAA